ncbi:RdRP domain-containing protein [Trichoderma afarasin]
MAGPRKWLASRAHPNAGYPTRITTNLWSLDFGTLTGPETMNINKTVTSHCGTNTINAEVDVLSKRLTIFFPLRIKVTETDFTTREFKLSADLSLIKTVFHVSNENDRESLVLRFPLPPQYFWKTHTLPPNSLFARNPPDIWRRATDITEDDTVPKNYPVSLNNTKSDPAYLEVGRWTAFRMTFNTTADATRWALGHMKLALEDLNIKIQVCENFQVGTSTTTMWDFLDHPQENSQKDALALLQPSKFPFVHLDFGVRYQLEVCVGRRVLNEHTISLEFLQKLAELDPIDAKRRLEFLLDQGEVMYDPKELFAWSAAASYVPNTRIPHYCVLARKAAITPTTILLSSPIVETSNRVLRYFNHIQDRFLRVQFVEETELGRIAMSSRNKEDVWKKIFRTLYQGIQIGDRRYEFLAFGSSQLRQCGAYFFCPTDHISCDDIRRWMGEVGHIRIVAKHAARLGQCFSTTREMRGLPVPDVRRIPDIERNGYCFTDGVGMISEFMARMIIEEMTMDVFTEPSAFQFRMGGCKGVLVVWPQAKKGEVYIRESQEKFKADVKGLEIIKCAKYSSATLNRQTVTILECLGVTTQAFLDVLEKQIGLYEEAIKDNNVAVDILTKCVDENQSTLVLAELLQAGFKTDTVQEPFVTNLLTLWRSWSLKLLKEKARIPIEKSAFVLGCVDETGTLRGHSNSTEGTSDKDVNKLPQIFLQVSDSKVYDKTTVIKGVCVVGRNPSLHPGDIRVVEAVDIPELHHLRDIVVFPSTGDRPVPNMLSGGDLDGDDFFIIWEPTLIPDEWNHPAMNYSSPSPEKLERDVNADDLRDFFVKYMQNDVLPLIATAHLGLADSEGPKSEICLRLAELHSQAVDYPKTGEPAEWNPARHNPQEWPHFMEKRVCYKSEKALGHIYNRVIKQSIQFRPDWENAFDQRIINRFQLDNAMLKDARKIKVQYDISVRRILLQYNLETEFELYTSWAMSKPSIGSDYKRQEELGKEFDAVKQRFRDACYEAAGGHNEAKIDRFVAAMYKVTEEEIKIALFEHHRGPTNEGGVVVPARRLEPKSMPFISFPWIFPWVMIRIASDGKCNPKKSILAAAHQRVPVSLPPITPLAQENRSEANNGSIGQVPQNGTLSDGNEDTLAQFEENTAATSASLTDFGGFGQF